MNLERLRVFATVARSPTFAAAAQALSFTPSAVSQQMSRLESEVGATLVERSPQGLRLTPAGTALLARADEILALVGTAAAEVRATGGDRQRTVRIGATSAIAQTIGVRIVRVFAHRHPEMSAHLVEDDSERLQTRVREGELDAALVIADAAGGQRGIATDRLFADALVAVAADGDPLARLSAVTLARLASYSIVNSPAADGMSGLLCAGAEQGVQLRFEGHDLRDHHSARAFVAAGVGVAVMPRLATAVPFPGTVAVPIVGGVPPLEVALASNNRLPRSRAASAMLAIIREMTTEAKVAALAA